MSSATSDAITLGGEGSITQLNCLIAIPAFSSLPNKFLRHSIVLISEFNFIHVVKSDLLRKRETKEDMKK